MAGTGPTDLHALCEEFLAACVEALDSISAPGLAGAPERRYVSPGTPAFDCCDQLTVHAQAITETLDRNGLNQGIKHRLQSRVNLVQLVATATRCIPQLEGESFPSATDLEAAAEQTNADAWALWNHVWNLARSGSLFTLCDEVFWDGMRAINPSGGCGGWTLTLRAELQGYESP